uniref:ATP-binding protein n=1 Tax=Nonomuraea endophytica TaxID=714136 RepID=UPI0035E45A48
MESGGSLLLSGEPGVGKSALLRAACDHAVRAGARVLSAAGVEFETDLSFSALNRLLLPISGEIGHLAAAHRDALRDALNSLP